MIKIDMDKNINISDTIPKLVHDNQIEVIINEYLDGALEVTIQPWEPTSSYAKCMYENESLKEKIKNLEKKLEELEELFRVLW